MKRNYIFLLLFLCSIKSFGQLNWLWAHEYGGGSSPTFTVKTSIDASNNVFMTGTFESTQTFGPSITKTAVGNTDGFVARTDNNGTFAWVKTMGDVGSTVTCSDVTADDQGNVIVTGTFTNSMTIDSYTIYPYLFSGKDFFILKLDANGVVLWLKQAGGQSDDQSSSVTTDDANNVYVTGQYFFRCYFNNNTDSISSGTYTYLEIFIAKYDAAGNFIWAKSAGGSQGNDAGACIDHRGNFIYVGGSFMKTAMFGPHSVTANGNNTDAFVAKYDLSGNNIWVVKAGGQSGESAAGIGSDIYGNVFATGRFSGTASFGNGISLTDPNNYGQMFIVKYDSAGTTKWARQAGGNADDVGTDIAVDSFGLAVVTGQFVNNATFPPSSLSLASVGAHDIFVVKYNMSGTPQWVLRAGGALEDVGNGVAFSIVANEYYVTGCFSTSADFGSTTLSSGASPSKCFVGKIQGYYTGTQEISGFENFSSYPNPADNMVTIQSPVTEKTECMITDATGRLVFSETLNNEFFQTTINTEKWQQGLYFITMKSDKINSTNKLLIQH